MSLNSPFMNDSQPASGMASSISPAHEQSVGVEPASGRATQSAGFHAHATQEEHLRGDLKLWFLLLVIVCLASFGSLSFSTILSPTSSTGPKSSTPRVYTDGVCSAKPTDIHYLTSTAPPSGTTGSALYNWSQTGKTQQDRANVQACAASFTLKYEAYSFDNLNSLEASVPMLSAAARQRFYTPDPQAPINRMDQMWRATIQKQHLVRTVQVQQPFLVNAKTVNGRILVWITVPYALTIQTNGDTSPSNASLTVLLVNAPTNITTGTGWQVSGWNDDPGEFAPQYPL